MKIRRTSDSSISFELCKQDLSALKISREEIDFCDDSARELLHSILKRLYPQSVCDLDKSTKIIVDSFKNQSDEVALKLTLLKDRGEGKKSIRVKSCALIFEFSNIDSLLDAAFSCNGKILLKKSSLYEKNNIFRLVLYPDADTRSCLILNEFCTNIFSTEIELFNTIENYSCICCEHALSSLCQRFVL